MTPWLKFSAIFWVLGAAGVAVIECLGRFSWGKSLATRYDRLGEKLCGASWLRATGVAEFLLFLICLGLYLLTLSTSGSFDEFDYAMRVREPGFFYHFNHFLPHVFAGLFYRVFYQATHTLDSLLSTKILNSIFGAVNTLLVFRIILRLSRNTGAAFFAGLLFLVSFGTWKFSTSGEVYTIMMTALLACLLYFIRLLQTDDWSARALSILAILANICVFAHNTTALISIAMGVPILIKDRKLFFRYALYGFIAFVVLQTVASVTHGIYTPRAWYDYAFHYGTSGYATANGLVNFNLFQTLPITLRDGTVTIIAGLETSFFNMPIANRALTLLIYASVAMAVVGSWWILLRNGKALVNKFFNESVYQALVLHLIVFGIFYSIWTPGSDEFMHWLIPFEIFVCVYSFVCLGIPMPRVALSLAILVPLVLASSLGTSRLSQSKILSSRFAGYILDWDTKEFEFLPGDILVYRYNEADQVARYYFPGGQRIAPKQTAAYLKENVTASSSIHLGGRVFVTTHLLEDFPPIKNGLRLIKINPSYWQVETLPTNWAVNENVRVVILSGRALRETWPNPNGHVAHSEGLL